MSDIIKTINNMQIQDTSDPDIQILTIDTTKEEMQNSIHIDETIDEKSPLILTKHVIYPTPITGYLLLKEIVPSLDYLYVKETKDEDTELFTYDFSKTYKASSEGYLPISFEPFFFRRIDGLGFGIIKSSDITECGNYMKQLLVKYNNNITSLTKEEQANTSFWDFKLNCSIVYDVFNQKLTPFNRYKEGFIWDVSTSKDYEESDITNTPEAYIDVNNSITLTVSDDSVSFYNFGYMNPSSQISTDFLTQVIKVENDYITLSAKFKGTTSFYLAKNLSGYAKLQTLANKYKTFNYVCMCSSIAMPE